MPFPSAPHARTRLARARAAAPAPAVPARPLSRAIAQAFAGGALSLLVAAPTHANPSGATVVHGQASFHTSGNRLTVTNSAGAAIDWRSFSIGVGETTHFQQPHAASAVLNRVTGADPSRIFGTLSSNGKVVLVNPAGIAVGAGAVVDTAGFTASTLSITNADWAAGRMRFFNEGSAGAVQVDGSIRAKGGDIVLMAPQVEVGTQAFVQAQDGSVILAAGQKAEITGRGLEGIRFELKPGGTAVNLGRLEGDAVGIFAGTLRHSGVIRAHTALGHGGRVLLLADDISLLDQAVIDASGANAGGVVQVGGEQGGAPAQPEAVNAREVYLGSGTTVTADAAQRGDGGRVIVWADDTASVHGTITARGGPAGGNGGFVETSGKRLLYLSGRVDVSAPLGRGGTWLLDPEDVDIGDDADDNVDQDGTRKKPRDARTSKINAQSINRALDAGGQVIIDTSDGRGNGKSAQIRVNKPLTKTTSVASTLEFWAHGDIFINADITSSGGVLNLLFKPDQDPSDGPSGGSTYLNANLQTAGGSITLQGNPVFHWASNTTIDTGGGNFDIPASGLLDLVGAGQHRLVNTRLANFGAISFASGGSLLVNNGSTLANQDGAEIVFNGDATITENAGCAPACLFTNEGTLRQAGTAGGEVHITGDALRYEGSDAVLDAGSGVMRFLSPEGGHSHRNTLTLVGDVRFEGGTHAFVDNTIVDGTLNIAGATANFGSVQLGALTRYTGGALNIGSADILSMPASGVFQWGANTTIAGGTLLVPSTATLEVLGGGEHRLSGVDLQNFGTLAHGGGNLLVNDGSTLFNAQGGSILFSGSGTISENSGCANVCLFANEGTIRQTSSGGDIVIGGGSLEYAGTDEMLDAGTGTLRFASGHGGHTHTGTSTFLGNVRFEQGTHTFANNAVIDGTFNIAGASIVATNLALDLETNYLSGAFSVGGNLTLPANSVFNWGANTTLAGGGTVIVPTSARFNINGGGEHRLSGVTLRNAGTIHHGGGTLLVNNGSTLNNQSGASIVFNGDGAISENSGCGTLCLFTNDGTIRQSATAAGDIVVGGGSLRYAGTNETLDAANGTLRFASSHGGHTHTGTSTFLGNVRFEQGTHTFANNAVIDGTFNIAGASIVATNLALDLETNYLSGAFSVGGNLTLPANSVFNWGANTTLAGGGTVIVPSSSRFNIDGGGEHRLSGVTLRNAGTIHHGGGTLLVNNGSTLHNQAGASIVFNGDGTISENAGCGTLCLFTNDGTIRQSATAGGDIVVGGGSLRYAGTNETLDAANGTLRFASSHGGHTHTGTSTFLGNVRFEQGTHTFANNAVIDGTFNIAGASIVATNLALDLETNYLSGAFSVGGNLTLPANSVFNWGANTTLAGGGTVIVPTSARFNINGGGEHRLSGVTLRNAGTINHGGGTLLVNNGSTLHNQAGASIVFNGDGTISENAGCGTLCLFTNDGTIRQSATAGGDIVVTGGSLRYVGTNETLDAGPGTLRFASSHGGHSHAGTVTLRGQVRFESGTHAFADNTVIDGTLNIDGARADFGSVTLGAQTNYNSGELRIGTGDVLNVAGTGVFRWGANTTISGGTLRVGPGASVDIAGGGEHRLSGTTLQNLGTADHRGGSLLVNDGATLLNGGVFKLLAGSSISENSNCNPCLFVNDGTLVKTGGDASTLTGSGLAYRFNAGSTLRVESGSVALDRAMLNEGTVDLHAGGTLSTGNHVLTNAGTGVITGLGSLAASKLHNAGSVRPGDADGIGTLTLAGDYEQAAGGQLAVGFASTSSHGRLLLTSGGAQLAGKLTVLPRQGASLAAGESFDALTASGTVAGSIAAEPAQFTAAIAAQAVRVGPTPPPPPPAPQPPAPQPPAPQPPAPPPPAAQPPAPQDEQPAQSPPPPSDSAVDRIVTALGGNASAAEVQQNLEEVDATLNQSLTEKDRKKEAPKKTPPSAAELECP